MVIESHDWAAQLPYKVPVMFDRQKSISIAFCILCCVPVKRMEKQSFVKVLYFPVRMILHCVFTVFSSVHISLKIHLASLS